MTAPWVAVPSRGRLRTRTLELLGAAGYATSRLHGNQSIAPVDGLSFIEMRSRDAARALAAGQVDAAFIATDLVEEHELDDLDALPLGFARSDLVVASRDDDGRITADDLAGCTVATHLPHLTRTFFARRGVDVAVLELGGSLEGVCAAGIADAIVDLRETGASLARNRLRVLEVMTPCQALFVRRADHTVLDDMALRLGAALAAGRHRYVMLHVQPAQVDKLRYLFPGLASPTVLPLAGTTDLVAVHFVVGADELWERLGDLRALGATGIVAVTPQAIL
ncbi:MAG TPA: ATP phosphoribosyltransferase [Euzebyales bacterium]